MSLQILEQSPDRLVATIRCDHCGLTRSIELTGSAACRDAARAWARGFFVEVELIAKGVDRRDYLAGLCHVCDFHADGPISEIRLPPDAFAREPELLDALLDHLIAEGAETFTVPASAVPELDPPYLAGHARPTEETSSDDNSALFA